MRKTNVGTGVALACVLLAAPAAEAQLLSVGALVTKIISELVAAGAHGAARSEAERQALTTEDKKRGIPDGAIKATMSPPRGRLVAINGVALQLSPGAKIRDTHNRIVQPGRIQRDVQVRFTLDATGQVRAVWLLADDYYSEVPEAVASYSENTKVAAASSEQRGVPSR